MLSQVPFWDSIADSKTFSHPLDLNRFAALVDRDARILASRNMRSILRRIDRNFDDRRPVAHALRFFDSRRELVERAGSAAPRAERG